ncbi:MAG: hypothetical protein WC558_07000 [Patulibacter sp.]
MLRTLPRIALTLAVGAGALVGHAVLPAGHAAGPPRAEAACRIVTIDGERKCMSRPQFCSPRHQSDYRRHGFRCVRDKHGRYRLRERS